MNYLKIYGVLFILMVQNSFSQKNCDYAVNVNDSIGTLKTTKDYLMYEKQFGASETYIYFSLSNANGTPFLTFQLIEKNNGFITTTCLDSKSRVIFQLENGKIISLISATEDVCGTLMIDTNGKNTRILTGNFLFPKNSFEVLKENPISIIRIKSMGNSKDYIIKSEFISDLLKKVQKPTEFFNTFLPCVEED